MSPVDLRKQQLHLTPIQATSPSLAETMRLCLLRAGLARTTGASEWALGHPKAWLGTAYHAVLEAISKQVAFGDQSGPDLDALWRDAIATLYAKSSRHPLARRFGEPRSWPGYYIAWAHMRQRAKQLLARPGRIGPRNAEKNRPIFVEQAFTALDGKLVGRPDLVRDGEVLDYKTGEIFEDDQNEPAGTVKASYVRQLHLYGLLASTALGVPIHQGVLLPMAGERVEVELDPSACAKEAEIAVGFLDRYNELVGAGATPADLASPSPEHCRWCPYQSICPALWKAVEPSWFGKLDGELVRGRIADAPKALHDGQALSMAIAEQAGTVSHTTLELFPLNVDIHATVQTLGPGETVRITGLGRRKDRTVFPSMRTVILREASVPELKVIPSLDKHALQNCDTQDLPGLSS